MSSRFQTPEIVVDEEAARTLGRNVQAQRELYGWSQAQLAVYAGIERGTVASVENGSTGTRLRTLLRIAAVFGQDLIELMSADYAPSSATPPYPGVRTAARDRRLHIVGTDPPGSQQDNDPSSPAQRRALSSALPAKVVRPRSVASQQIAVDRATSKVEAARDARGPSPDGRR